MRIVHFTDTFQPQLGYQDFFLAREQLRAGHDVVVVTGDRYFRFPSYATTVQQVLGPRYVGAGRFVEQGIPVLRLPVRFELRSKLWVAGLVKAVRDLRPDVVHVHNIANLSATRLALGKSRIGSRLLFDDHMHYSILRKRGWTTRAAQRLQRALFTARIVDAGDAFVAITEETATLMDEVYGVPKDRIVVIPLGVDVDLFRPDPEGRARTRETLHFGDDDVVLVYTGKVIPDKGPDVLVRAALRLRRSGGRVRVLLVGGADPGYVREMMTMAPDHEMRDALVLHPPVRNADLPRLLNAGDIGVWPREESIGMLEAAACGLPIVVKASDGLRDRVAARNGLMYRERDDADLARVLGNLLDVATRRFMGSRGRALVQDRFSWRSIADQFQVLYEGGQRDQ